MKRSCPQNLASIVPYKRTSSPLQCHKPQFFTQTHRNSRILPSASNEIVECPISQSCCHTGVAIPRTTVRGQGVSTLTRDLSLPCQPLTRLSKQTGYRAHNPTIKRNRVSITLARPKPPEAYGFKTAPVSPTDASQIGCSAAHLLLHMLQCC